MGRAKKNAVLAAVDPTPVVVAYKAFEAGYVCQGYSFADKDEHEVEGEISVCGNGFHACSIPLDTWQFYPPKTDSCYAKVEQSGTVDTDTTKNASARLKISLRLSLPAFIKAQVDVIWERLKGAATTGARAHAATTGARAHAATTGDWAHAATTGDSAHAATTGDSAHAATTGDWAHAATTGDWAHAATTGDSAHAATTGARAHAATTGDSAHAATTGARAHAATTGARAHAATTGVRAHAACLGLGGTATCGPKGSITLAWWDAKADRPRLAVGYEGDGIEAGVAYRVDDTGEFVRAEAQPE